MICENPIKTPEGTFCHRTSAVPRSKHKREPTRRTDNGRQQMQNKWYLHRENVVSSSTASLMNRPPRERDVYQLHHHPIRATRTHTYSNCDLDSAVCWNTEIFKWLRISSNPWKETSPSRANLMWDISCCSPTLRLRAAVSARSVRPWRHRGLSCRALDPVDLLSAAGADYQRAAPVYSPRWSRLPPRGWCFRRTFEEKVGRVSTSGESRGTLITCSSVWSSTVCVRGRGS